MDIKVARMHRLDGNGMTKAFCDVLAGGQLMIRGFRVVESRNGYFVGYPQELTDGKWYLTAHPVDDDTKDTLEREILKAYAGDSLKGGDL